MEMIRDTLHGDLNEMRAKFKELKDNEAKAMEEVKLRAEERLAKQQYIAEQEFILNRHERRRHAAIERQLSKLKA